MLKLLSIVCAGFLAAACTSPFSPDARSRLDASLTYADILKDPVRFTGQSLMLAGALSSLSSDERGSRLEILRWEVNRWGEPTTLAEAGERFVVLTPQPLDSDRFTRGRLVTLVGTVAGKTELAVNLRRETVPSFDLVEIHLWETPFRYGLRDGPDPGQPEYIPPRDPGPDHPYDPTPWDYPYSPYWYRAR